MDIEELIYETRKTKYQLQLLTKTIDFEKYRFESLILEMDWDEKQVEKIHHICESYSNKIGSGNTIEWYKLKNDFEKELDIGNPIFKQVILALYSCNSWTEVCVGYAKSLEPSAPIEFNKIIKENT